VEKILAHSFRSTHGDEKPSKPDAQGWTPAETMWSFLVIDGHLGCLPKSVTALMSTSNLSIPIERNM